MEESWQLPFTMADSSPAEAANFVTCQLQRPTLSPQWDQSLGKENMTFGGKLITLDPFHPRVGDKLSLLGLKHILGVGLSFLPVPSMPESLFKSSQSFYVPPSPRNSYFETLTPNTIVQEYLIWLCFTLLQFADIAFFTNWRFVATLPWARLSAPFFQHHLLTSCLCVTFW